MAGHSKTKIRPNINTDDARYLAGFFDGEGSIIIYGRKTITGRSRTSPYNLRITITNTHKDVMLWIAQTFGGNLCEYAPTGNRARAWKWTALCKDAEHVLRALLPYLIVKKAQTEVALEFQDVVSSSKARPYAGRRGQPPLSEEDMAIREQLAVQLRDLRAADKLY